MKLVSVGWRAEDPVMLVELDKKDIFYLRKIFKRNIETAGNADSFRYDKILESVQLHDDFEALLRSADKRMALANPEAKE